MPDPSPNTDQRDEAKKRLQEKVEKLVSADPWKSEGSIKLNVRTMEYTSLAAFIPVHTLGLDEKRGETEAAIFTTSYFLKKRMQKPAQCVSFSMADPGHHQFGCIWEPSVRNGWR